jgi:hypothetical protein
MRTEREQIGRVERKSIASGPRSAAQYVAGAAGLFMTVIAGVALARLLPTGALIGETVLVAGMGFTVVMAVLTLLLGLVFLGAAGRPTEGRAGLISLGIALLAFGIVIFIEPEPMNEALGVNETSGVVYALVGTLAAIAGVASNTLVTRRSIDERHMEGDEVSGIT